MADAPIRLSKKRFPSRNGGAPGAPGQPWHHLRWEPCSSPCRRSSISSAGAAWGSFNFEPQRVLFSLLLIESAWKARGHWDEGWLELECPVPPWPCNPGRQQEGEKKGECWKRGGKIHSQEMQKLRGFKKKKKIKWILICFLGRLLPIETCEWVGLFSVGINICHGVKQGGRLVLWEEHPGALPKAHLGLPEAAGSWLHLEFLP